MKFSELSLHHAILLTHGDRAGYSASLWEEVSALSPAHKFFNQTVLDIETARAIISWAQTPYNDERVALISFHTAGLPAQNAMLKVLEEPRSNTRFILVTTNRNNLIGTVLSRVHHIHLGQETLDTISQSGNAEIFLETSHAARMKLPFITEMLAKTDEEGRKDRESTKSFILALLEALRVHKAESRYISETLEIASYAGDPSASGKALLEYVALLLPQSK